MLAFRTGQWSIRRGGAVRLGCVRCPLRWLDEQFEVCIPGLAILLTFGLAGQHQLVASALALWWYGLAGMVYFGHLLWLGFDSHHVASGVVAVLAAWVLAYGLFPLF